MREAKFAGLALLLTKKIRGAARVMPKQPKFRRIATVEDDQASTRDKKIDFGIEARLFCNLAAPNVLIQVFSFALWMENSMYVGQTLGTTELAAVSLGNMCGNLTGLSLIFGMLSAMDTLAPQAMGSKQYGEIGVLVQRSTWLCMAMCLPCWCVWWNMETILLLLKQPPAASALAGRFLRVYCLGLPPMILFEVSRRFLGCQNIVNPYLFITGFVALLAHPFFLWFYITYCGYGFIGTRTSSRACSRTSSHTSARTSPRTSSPRYSNGDRQLPMAAITPHSSVHPALEGQRAPIAFACNISLPPMRLLLQYIAASNASAAPVSN
jgi:hypothetical protein